MKAVVTGASGTVGSALMQTLKERGIEGVPWNRQRVPVNNPDIMRRFLDDEQPDLLFHLAVASQSTGLINEEWHVNRAWPQHLARLCDARAIRLLFTSSVMVYSDDAKGPFTVETDPDAREGSYGYEKLLAEQDILHLNPNAVVARIGWQIGSAPGSNNMIDHLDKQMAQNREIRASDRWLPACSFLADTAAALIDLAQLGHGVYLVDSNTRWTFYEIVTALNEQRGNPWRVIQTDDFVYDQRMQDPRVEMASLDGRLPNLPN